MLNVWSFWTSPYGLAASDIAGGPVTNCLAVLTHLELLSRMMLLTSNISVLLLERFTCFGVKPIKERMLWRQSYFLFTASPAVITTKVQCRRSLETSTLLPVSYCRCLLGAWPSLPNMMSFVHYWKTVKLHLRVIKVQRIQKTGKLRKNAIFSICFRLGWKELVFDCHFFFFVEAGWEHCFCFHHVNISAVILLSVRNK